MRGCRVVLVTAVILFGLLEAAEEAGSKPLTSLQMEALVKRYVEGDAAERQKVLGECAGADALKAAGDVKAWSGKILAALQKKGPRMNPVPTDLLARLDGDRLKMCKMLGVGTSPVATLESAVGQVRTVVLDGRMPRSPVVIYLHGGGHVPPDHPGEKDNEMAWTWGLKRSAMIKCAPFKLLPRCVDDKAVNAWVIPSGPQAVNAVLDALLRTCAVDPDRIYLMGSSMGGFGAWYFASIEADRFAAVASLGGGCTVNDNGFANYCNLDFGAFVGEQDTAADRLGGSRRGRDTLKTLNDKTPAGYKCFYKEYAGVGHNLPDKVYADVDSFLKDKARQAYPRVVVWHPVVAWKPRFYNLAIPAPKEGMSVKAEMGKDNTVTVTSENVPALTVYLNEQLADFKKPLKVVWNGKEAFAGILSPCLSVVLETLGDRCDPGMFYSAKVSLR
ncbi:MAG: hypothetical protein NTW87_07860 [Planctomycetota bacterium]|nr:hypothetical protein [Planctomycetota bacterium]